MAPAPCWLPIPNKTQLQIIVTANCIRVKASRAIT